MRGCCIICTDIFISDSDISVTECGHAFHSACVYQWLERSKTCPQCRQKSTGKKLIKLFLNQLDNTLTEIEPDQLQHEIESLKFKVTLKNQELKTAEADKSKYEEQAKSLREEVLRLEKKVTAKDETVMMLKMQVKCYGDATKQLERSRAEFERVRAQLKHFSRVESIVKQTSTEVESMLSEYPIDSERAARDMATYCLILKKELTVSSTERRQLSADRHRLRVQLSESRLECQQLQTRASQLQPLEEQLASVELENARLSKQVKCLQAAVVSPSGDPRNSALTRLLTEHPTPQEVRLLSQQSNVSGQDTDGIQIISQSDDEYDANEAVSNVSSAPGTSQDSEPSAGPKLSGVPNEDVDLSDDSPRVTLAKVTGQVTLHSASRKDRHRLSRLGSITASPTLAKSSRNPFVLKCTVQSKRSVDCSKLKKVNLLTTNIGNRSLAAPSIKTPVALPIKNHNDGKSAGWDGLGGSSRPDVFPKQRARVNVKLNNGASMMCIDNFFSRS